MAPEFNALSALEPRCTPFAMELLRELANHPRFPELITRLMQEYGILPRADIERTYIRIRNTGHDR